MRPRPGYFAYGLALVRIAGRRVFGRWSALDIIVSVMVGSDLSRALTGSAELGGTPAATTLLMMALHWALARMAAHSTRFSGLVEGTPIQLAHDGAAKPSVLRHYSVSQHDLEEALRQSNLEHVAGTRLIVLEPSGKITVLKGSSERVVQSGQR